MKLKVVEGYFFEGNKVYRAGDVFEKSDDAAAALIARACGDIVSLAEEQPATSKDTAKTSKKAVKVESDAAGAEEEEGVGLPDVDAAASIRK